MNKLIIAFSVISLFGCISTPTEITEVKDKMVIKTLGAIPVETIEDSIGLINASEEGNYYTAIKGDTLKSTINKWSIKNEYTLDWGVISGYGDKLDWKIGKDLKLTKSYHSSVVELLRAYKKHKSIPVNFTWKFYKKNKVLVVVGGSNEQI